MAKWRPMMRTWSDAWTTSSAPSPTWVVIADTALLHHHQARHKITILMAIYRHQAPPQGMKTILVLIDHMLVKMTLALTQGEVNSIAMLVLMNDLHKNKLLTKIVIKRLAMPTMGMTTIPKTTSTTTWRHMVMLPPKVVKSNQGVISGIILAMTKGAEGNHNMIKMRGP